MLISELVAAVTTGIERPDFTMDNPWFRMQVQHTINMAHSLGWFSRDLESTGKLHIPANLNTLACSIPKGFRAIKNIALFDDAQNPLPCNYTFEKGEYNFKPKDYFGYTKPYSYFTFGNSITLNFPPNNKAQHAEITYYSYPQVSYNASQGIYECSSFILREFPGLLVYDLMRAIGTITSSDLERSLVTQYNEAMVQMMGDISVQ